MGFNESIDVLLLTRRRAAVLRCGLCGLLALLLLDAAATVGLRMAPGIADPAAAPAISWSWPDLGPALVDFGGDTLDLIVLFVLRTALLALLAALACRYGQPDYTGLSSARTGGAGGPGAAEGGAADTAGGLVPLLSNAADHGLAPVQPTHNVRRPSACTPSFMPSHSHRPSFTRNLQQVCAFTASLCYPSVQHESIVSRHRIMTPRPVHTSVHTCISLFTAAPQIGSSSSHLDLRPHATVPLHTRTC